MCRRSGPIRSLLDRAGVLAALRAVGLFFGVAGGTVVHRAGHGSIIVSVDDDATDLRDLLAASIAFHGIRLSDAAFDGQSRKHCRPAKRMLDSIFGLPYSIVNKISDSTHTEGNVKRWL